MAVFGRPAVVLLLLALCSSARAQFPTDRLPIEEVSATDIFRACELPIESEVEEGVQAPESLLGVGVSGKWAYEKTNRGILRNPSLQSDTGKIDLWISNDTAQPNLGLLHDISAVFYITGEAAKNDALEATVMVRARGHYVPSKGILCLLGCQEALLPSFYTPTNNPNFTGTAMAGGGGGTYDELVDEPEAPGPNENVEAGVSNPTPVTQQLETQCRTRTVLRLRSKDGKNREAEVTGRLESLRQPGEAPFFSPIIISASTGDLSSQVLWFQIEMVIESLCCALQAACVFYQILQVRRFPEGFYTSLTMVSIQIFVYGFYWIRSLYYPLRYLNSEVLIYFLSDVANIPRFVEFIIFSLYIFLAVMVEAKRRKAMQPKNPTAAQRAAAQSSDVEHSSLLSGGGGAVAASGPGVTERQVALFYWPIYAAVGLCMWFAYDFDSFLRLSSFLFLLPQILLTYFWDLTEKDQRGVSLVFAIGNTLIQMIWLAYEVLRPRLMGYDAFFAFPHAWYWSSMVLMLAQIFAFIFQRLKGGRFRQNLDPYSTTSVFDLEPKESPATTELASVVKP